MIVLAHAVLVAAFLNHGGMQDRVKESGPASYIAFAFIAAPKPTQPVAAVQAPAITPPLRRTAPAATPERTPAPAVRQAKRPDCQTKYSGGEKANLLLLIPLAIETITDKACKW